jgi:pimeloyl-ACP methyl ester carboxylesterase
MGDMTIKIPPRTSCSSISLLCRVPLMITSEGVTAIAGLVSTALCGWGERSPRPKPLGMAVLALHGSGFNQSEFGGLSLSLACDDRAGPLYTMNYAGLLSGEKGATIQDYARKVRLKVEAIFEETKVRRIILVGHSMGGLIAAEVAERLLPREEVVKVVTICSPFGGVPILDSCCSTTLTDAQMKVGSPYLLELVARIRDRELRGEGVCYHHITSRLDLIVPPERAGAVLDQSKWVIFDGIEGHWGIVASPRVIGEVKTLIKQKNTLSFRA